jgi:DNA polymerase (family 10)
MKLHDLTTSPPSNRTMTTDQVAATLEEIAVLMELRGENPFKSNAYHTAARTIEQMSEDLSQVVAAGRLGEIRGIGSTLRTVITELVQTGRAPILEELRVQIPAGLVQMLRLPGLGPKKIIALSQAGIGDLDALKLACEAGAVAKLKGFGGKTQDKILAGLAFVEQVGQRIRIDEATAVAGAIVAVLKRVPGVKHVEPCGSLRRRRETIGDVDILAAADDPAPVMAAFTSMPGISQVISQGETLSAVSIPVGSGAHKSELRADLRVVSPAQFPFALAYFTGSKAHNVAMRGRAKDRGWRLNEYSMSDVACQSETDIYSALGLDYVEPELREDTGEIDAAENHTLPKLVAVRDIRGVFHNHTTASDGTASLAEMAAAAQDLGFEYLGIADHSQSLAMARGLTPERVRQQHLEIAKLNESFDGFRIFKGTECDILADGSLDFDDETLGLFDYVVASVHTVFGQPREEMTARIVKAVRHPLVTMLGHSTGRLLLRREGYAVDLDAVLRAAAESGTMIEINAQPSRLDLDWVHCKKAKAMGIKLVINPDAHSTGELELFTYGVDVARRGWLEKGDVFNTQSLRQIERALGL